MKRYIRSVSEPYQLDDDYMIIHSIIRPYYTGFAVLYVEDNHADILFKGTEDECLDWKREQIMRIRES